MNLYEKAFSIAKESHKGQKDKAGVDYIEHLKATADNVRRNFTDKIIAVAYLHDILEDTSITDKDLMKMGMPIDVVIAIKALTKEKGESYIKYLERVKENLIARIVKLADLEHNMDLSRIENPKRRDFERLEKYQKAVLFLKGEVN